MSRTKPQKTKPKRIGYARCSTNKQTTFQHTDLLTRNGCDHIFLDEAVSATVANRAGLQGARAALKSGDVFVVPAIDRAFRSTLEGIQFLDQLHADGIAFESIFQRIDTRTPEGRKWFIDMVNNAEYERAIISRRTKEKMAAAIARGKHCGRPYALTEWKVRRAYSRIMERGESLSDNARRYRVSVLTLRRSFKRWGLAL
ncbi:MAG: recombinase family protein [Pseudomonadota bacterium]